MEEHPQVGNSQDGREISGEKILLNPPLAPENVTSPPDRSDLAPSPNLLAETTIDSRYRVINKMGEGGMAIVYKIERLFFGDVSAMKVGKHSVDQKSGKRFHQEAKTSIHLEHPNLLKVYDFGLIGEQFPYFVMEFVDGTTLADRIASEGSLSIEETMRIFEQICDGVAYAHGKKIVHRDIKPSNIVVSGSGDSLKVKLLDFGIAKFLEDESQQKLTSTGEIFGSPLYMSPEQCGGRVVDHRSDIYSMGCTMFEALTGAPPFHGDSVFGTIMMHQSNQPSSLKESSLGRDFPDALEQLVKRMLAKSPDDRYQSASELKADIVMIGQGKSIAPAAEVRVKYRLQMGSQSPPLQRLLAGCCFLQ